MIGSHLSIAGGMVNALLTAQRLKMECVQVFTKNQRQWGGGTFKDEDCVAWLDQLRAMKWDSFEADRPARVISHNSYLINLASPDPELWRRSVAAQRAEMERCEALHIPLCVGHPGAHLGKPRDRRSPNGGVVQFTRDERAGLRRVIKALNQIHRDLPGNHVVFCLETTVGSGSNLGSEFCELEFIRAGLKDPERVGYCLDTCHVTAAGYDMSTDDRAAAVLDQFDQICGLQNLRVFHINDSIGAIGSRRDRHAHIGAGCCGRSCFRTILNCPAFEFVPMILETPKQKNEKGVDWDILNVRKLKRMRRVSNTVTTH